MTEQQHFFVDAPASSDAAALSHLAQSVFRQTFDFMNYPPDDLAAFFDRAMSTDAYAVQIADPAYSIRVARDVGGAMVGFVKCGPNDLPLPAGEPDRARTRELHQLYIASAAHGSGLADRLMRHVFDDAANWDAQAIYLSVFVDNHRAQRFYARHGFVEIGKNPFPVGTTVDDDRVWRCRL